MTSTQVAAGGSGGLDLGKAITDLIGFYGATPISQPTAAAQAAVTDNSGGTANASTGIGPSLASEVIAIPVQMSTFTNGHVYSIDPGFNGKLVSAAFRCVKPATGAGATAALQAQVNGVSLTGGVVTPTLANTATAGALVPGTAITAGTQTFTSSQSVGVTVSGVTSFTAGDGFVEFVVVNTDLANSIATILAQTNAVQAALVNLGLIKGG